MTHFSVGDRVIIRWGYQQGHEAKIIKNPQADVFKVKIDDGSVLFFSGKGLEMQVEAEQRAILLKAGGRPMGIVVPPRDGLAPIPLVNAVKKNAPLSHQPSKRFHASPSRLHRPPFHFGNN